MGKIRRMGVPMSKAECLGTCIYSRQDIKAANSKTKEYNPCKRCKKLTQR